MEPIASNNNTAMDVDEAEATPSLQAKAAADDEATTASSPTANNKEDDYESDSDNDTQMEEPEPENQENHNNSTTKTEQPPEPEKPLSSSTAKAATTTKPTSAHSEPSIYPIELPLDFVPAPEDVVLGQQEQDDESRNDDDDTKPNNRTAQFLELVRNSMREYSQTTDKQARMLLLKVAKTRASKEYGRFVRVVEGNRYVEIGVAQAMRECVKAHHRHQQQHHQASSESSRHYPHQRSSSSLGGSLSGLDNAREPLAAPDKKRCKNAPQFARSSSSSSSKTIQQALPKDYKPRSIDVIFGRGGGVNQHPGNQFYRRVLQQQQQHYMKSQKLDKVRVARHVLEQVQNRGGMFVQNVPCWGGWCQVKDSVALSKIAQGFRDCKKQDDTHSASSSGTSASVGVATSAASAVVVGVVPPPLDTTAAAALPQKPQPVVWGNPNPPSSHRSSPAPSMVVSPQLSPRPPFEQLAAASAASTATQDPSAEALPSTSVLASLYPTRAQLDHDIRQLQSVLAQAQHSQDLALLQAAVHAEERLPLLQALQPQHPPLASLQQERDGLRQRLSSNTGLAPKKRLALAKRVADLTQQCQREEQALWQYRIVAAASVTPTTTIAAVSAPTATAAAPQPLVVTPNRRRAQQPLMMSSFRSAAATSHRLSKEELEEDDNNSSANSNDVVIISSDDSERGTLLLPVTSPTITQQEQTIQEARDEGYRQRNDNDDDDDDASSSSGSSSASSVSLICAV